MENTSLIESIKLKLADLEKSQDVRLYKSLSDTLQALNSITPNKQVLPINTFALSGNPKAVDEGGMSNKRKVATIFKEAGRFLHMREIVEIAKKKEPNTDPLLVSKRIQQAVYSLKNDKVIVTYNADESNLNVFWGSKSWLEADGKTIKPNHIYNENQLSGKMKESIEI